MKHILHILLIFTFLFGLLQQVDARIDMTVSPIKYEIEVEPGDVVPRTATLFNYSDEPLYITTSTAEFISDGSSGKPVIIRPENSTSVASWITIHTLDFTLQPNAQQTISFDIEVPNNATPGGHYGALFFENDAKGISSGSNIGINVDYGVLLLINVSGDIIIDGGVGEVTVDTTGGATGRSGGYTKDSCPLGDFSKSNFDGKCIDNVISGNNEDEDEDENTNETNTQNENTNENNTDDNGAIPDNSVSENEIEQGENSENINSPSDSIINSGNDTNSNDSELGEESNIIPEDIKNPQDDDIDIKFKIPFDNKGNTHIKPTGKIILKDENNRQIPNIGKTVILNDNGAIIGEEIVDYIPINDIGGNVLPQTQRIFEGAWEGFPYKDRNLEGDEIIKYWSPGEYYSFQNIPDNKVLNFWERTLQRTNTKKIEAEIQVSYIDINGEEVEFNSAEEFYIEYVDTYIGVNKYIIALILFGFGFIFLFILVKRKKKKICINRDCQKKIDKDLAICPYCETKQEDKKKGKGFGKKKKSNSEKKEKKKKKS